MNNNQNKALWIFSNIKESVDMLPQSLRGKAWEMIINYSFGDENVEKNCKNNKILLVFRVVKPLLRLRGIAGSQGGKSNNPSGLAKNKEPNIAPNIGANITPNLLNNNNSNSNNNNKEKRKQLVNDDWYPDEKTVNKLKEKKLNVDKVVDKFINSCQAKNLKYIDFNKAILSWNWDNDQTLKQEENKPRTWWRE